MDISNSYQSNNTLQTHPNAGGALGYDLNSEKQEIEEITQEVKKELLAKWKKSYANAQILPASIAAMHPEVVDFLLSFELVSIYDNIARQANLDAKGRSFLPHIVWQIAQAKNWNDIDQMLEARIPLVHSVHMQVVDLLKKNILDKIQLLSEKRIVQKNIIEEVSRKETQLSLTEALSQYPKLGEQNITTDQIKLRFMPSLVRPSIKNWITDFHDAMGAMKHSPIDRGNFLFHSENGKKLSPADRQKLGVILKSLDEQSLLNIDTESQAVIFDGAQENHIAPSAIGNLERANGLNLPSRNIQTQFQENNSASVRQPLYQRESISDDIVEQVQPQREARPDINLRQNQIQSQSVNQNTFRSPMPALALEPGVKYAPLAEQHLSRPTVKNELERNATISKQPVSARVAPSMPKIVENKNDFFTIAQSKPPIGSEHFNAPVSAPKKEIIASEKIQDRDSMSDELLYKTLQEKASIGKAALAQGVVSFSSAQKLPAEQGAVQSQPARTIQASPYHISPTPHLYEKKETTPKIQGNVVDLRA
jgi:hypothetical protein